MRNEEPPRNSPRGSVLRARHGPYKCACAALSRGGRRRRKRYKRVCLLYISHEGHHCEAGAKRARSRTGAPPPSARACGRLLYSGSPAFRAGRRTCKNAGERGRGARALLSDPFSPRSDSSSESVQIWTWLGGIYLKTRPFPGDTEKRCFSDLTRTYGTMRHPNLVPYNPLPGSEFRETRLGCLIVPYVRVRSEKQRFSERFSV